MGQGDESESSGELMLNLVIIKSPKMEECKWFYGLFGLNFVHERHDQGPSHFAAVCNGCVIEIYPMTITQQCAGTGLGFKVQSLNDILAVLKTQRNGQQVG